MIDFIFLLYAFTWLAGLFAGLVWWLGLLQQKEYRFDRLRAHLHSLSTRQILLHIFPLISLLRPKVFKRPVKTLRVKVLLLANLLFIVLLASLLLVWVQSVPELLVSRLFLLPILLYLSAPLLLLLFTALTSCLVWLLTIYYLFRLRQLVKMKQPLVIGITGSFGKTTTKQLLAHVLSQQDLVCTTPGSVNTALGIARFVLKNLAEAKILVLEYAAYKNGEIAQLAAVVPPNLAILTGLGQQHLELFGSKQAIASAKAELLESLPAQSLVFCVNKSALDIIAVAKNKQNLKVKKIWLIEEFQIKTSIIGSHYKNTITAVAQVANHLGLSNDKIISGLKSFTPTDKWIRQRLLKGGAQLIDDSGTSNPDGFSAALKLLAQYPQAKKILLTAGIIDLGAASQSIHKKLAQEAKVYVNEVWYLGEVGKQAFAKIFAKKIFTNKEEITRRLELLDKQTVILIEGRIPSWLIALL